MTARGPFNALPGCSRSRAAPSPRGRRLAWVRRLSIAALIAAVVQIVPAEALAVWPFDGDEPEGTEDLGERAAQVLSRAIRIRTVNPPGNEAALARYLVEVAEQAELEAGTVVIPDADSGTASQGSGRALAWARVPGSGKARPIVLLSHLDVVDADPNEWTHPPFEGLIQDGRVIGRGALDAKGVSVIQLMTLIQLAALDEPLDRDVIWLATPDEESGGELGAGWVARERPDLLHGAEFLLTEGGGVRVGGAGTPAVWGVSITEKSPCWLALSARGPSGHASAPNPASAVPRLVAALDSVRRIETRVRVLPEVQAMFAALAPVAPAADLAGYLDLRTALNEDRRFRRRFLANPARNALVRNTIAITVVAGGTRTNVVPATARAQLDARLLPGESCSDLASGIANVVAEHSVHVETLLSFASNGSPTDTALYRAIERVALRDDPEAIVVPRMSAGFSDAHYFRDLGIASYGFVPRWLSNEETRGIHGADEQVSIQNLERATRTLVAILEELDEDPEAPLAAER